jgi:hypothetical protein
MHQRTHRHVRRLGHHELVPLELSLAAPFLAQADQRLLQFVAGERDVPGLLYYVDPGDHPDQRLDPLVVHHVALPAIDRLLADQGGRVRTGTAQDARHQVANLAGSRSRPVRRDSEAPDRTTEHRRVPALVGNLGELVLGSRGGRVVAVDVLEQQLHQDDLEPQADTRDRSDLVFGEQDLLFQTQGVPQRRAVERHPFGLHPPQTRDLRGVPVDVDVWVVGLLRGRLQESLDQSGVQASIGQCCRHGSSEVCCYFQ